VAAREGEHLPPGGAERLADNVAYLTDNRDVTDTPHSPSGVSETAFSVAQARAEESRQSDRLFDDPLGACGRPVPAAVAAANNVVRRYLATPETHRLTDG
jgi:hypothetical protein